MILHFNINFSQLFTGNTDASSVVQRTFANPFVARKVRLHVKSWNNEPVLRMELYGSTTRESINPLSSKIHIHILQTDLHTFLLRIVERIWFKIKSFCY